MAFYSVHAPRIWEDLYTALIPDQVTQNAAHVRVFGTYISGHTEVDRMMENNVTMVKIPIIKMIEYFDNGIPIQIPERESMLEIHRNIEKYLQEWRHHAEVAINSDVPQHRDLLLSLEKFSKLIYGKATAKEVMRNPVISLDYGLLNPLSRLQMEQKEVHKPDYAGIGQLIRQKGKVSRY